MLRWRGILQTSHDNPRAVFSSSPSLRFNKQVNETDTQSLGMGSLIVFRRGSTICGRDDNIVDNV